MLTMPHDSSDEKRFAAMGLSLLEQFALLFTQLGATESELFQPAKPREQNTLTTRREAVEERIRLQQGSARSNCAATPGKTRVTIRLDNDILEHFLEKVDRAGGGNYQSLINDALREYIQGARLEAVVRQAVRREVKAAQKVLRKTA